MYSGSQKFSSSFLVLLLFVSSIVVITEQTASLHLPFVTVQGKFLPSNNVTGDYWPTDDWRNSTPEAEGMNPSVLNDMLDFIDAEDYPIDSVFIVKNGYVVFEEHPTGYYGPDSRHEMHSVTKSFASTLIGIALQQGLLDNVSQLLLDFFPEYTQQNPDPRWNEITIEHLLTMSAGFEWDESTLPYTDPNVNDIGGMIASDDAVQFVLDKPMLYTPGEHWHYSGGVSLLLGAIIEQIYDRGTRRFADDFLFDPLGIDSVSWFAMPGGWLNTYGGALRVRPRDMAKLGYLYLNNGTWNDTQILPADYVQNATYPHFTNLPFPPDFTGYGWQWWLLRDLETFAALGRAGQKIIVSREHDMITVFTASVPDNAYDPEFDLYFDYIIESIGTFEPNPLTDSMVMIGVLVGVIAVPIVAAAIYFSRKISSRT
ncbi:MAG: serine hydrolase [Candidatus Thorarchaeota archaeon]|nr:MAG: serine hydrolase [Candidatus Thorarchaeota archaeon]